MCIRDSFNLVYALFAFPIGKLADRLGRMRMLMIGIFIYACLLYTSDAADERSSVDLGGRRIIKKKK